MMTKTATRVIDVVDYIAGYHDRHGYAPSMREICRHFGFRSTSTASQYLRRAAAAGYLEYSPRIPRSIVLRPRP